MTVYIHVAKNPGKRDNYLVVLHDGKKRLGIHREFTGQQIDTIRAQESNKKARKWNMDKWNQFIKGL